MMKEKCVSICMYAWLMMISSGYFFSAALYAQPCNDPPSCLINGELTSNDGGIDMNDNYASTVNGWYVSHGSPTIDYTYAPGGSPNGIWMWSSAGKSEGIYTCYNFQRDHQYQVCLWVKTDPSVLNPGNLKILAANGLTNTGPGSTILPTPTSSQLIDDSHTINTNWVQLTYLYTPDANYQQFWIYPYRAANPVNAGKYSLTVDRISIIEVPPQQLTIPVQCGGDIILDPGTTCDDLTYEWFDPYMSPVGTGVVTIHGANPDMRGFYTLRISGSDCSVESGRHVDIFGDCPPCELDVKFSEYRCNPVFFIDNTRSSGTPVAWFWDFGDGNTSTQETVAHQYNLPGRYEVCLTVIVKSGKETCCQQFCKTIEVCAPRDEVRLGEFKPGPGIQQDQTTPVNDISSLPGRDPEDNKAQLSVVPNPATSQAYITIKNMNDPSVFLMNINGAMLSAARLQGDGRYLFDLESLAPGVYLVVAEDAAGIATTKLIKTN